MKTLMKMVLGACLVHGAASAEVPAPEVKFSFDDDLDAGLHVNEGTAGAIANLTDSYSTCGRGRGALYDLGSGRIGVYGYSPWCRELTLGDSFTVAMSFKASALPNEILLCLGDLDGAGRVLMVTTDDETSVKVVVGNREVFEEARVPVSVGADRSHLLRLVYADGGFSASVDGSEPVVLGGDKPAGGFQILGGRSESQILPASFVHGCGVVDPQSGVVSHPNAANVVEDLCVWTTCALSEEHVAEYAAARFCDDPNAASDVGRVEADNTAIWRAEFNVGFVTEFAGYGWKLYKSDSVHYYLFTANGIDRIPFSNDKDDPDYAKSDIRKRINDFETQLKNYAGPQMSWAEVDGNGSGYISKKDLSDVIKAPYDDLLYLMSFDEARAMGSSKQARDVLDLGDMWYLRTPGTDGNGNAVVVVKGGYISDFGTKAHLRQYVRPSVKVSRESPLFSRQFFRTNGDDSGKIRKSDVEIGKGFAFGDGDEDAGGEEDGCKTTWYSPEIAAPEVLRVFQPDVGIIDIEPGMIDDRHIVFKDTMFVTPCPPTVTYRSTAIAQGAADHLAAIAIATHDSKSRIVDYAKVSAADEGTDVVIPFGKLARGRHYLRFFVERCEEGSSDYCSQDVGSFEVVNVGGRFREGEWPASVSNQPYTVSAEGVGIRFPEGVGFVQDFEAVGKGATFSGLGTRGGRIGGKVTVDAAELTVSNMTVLALAVTNGGVLNVTGRLAIPSSGTTLVDGSIALSAGSVLDVCGERCVVKTVSGTGVVTNSVSAGAASAAFVVTDRLTVDVARTDTLSVEVPLTLGDDFKVFVTNATGGVRGEWTILTASQIVAKPTEIKVVADDETTGPWEVKVVTLSDDRGEALVLANSEEYVRVMVGRLERQSAVWTSGDGAVTNKVENGFFDVMRGTEKTKVVFIPDYGYQFATADDTGVRELPTPIVMNCSVMPPELKQSPCAVEFVVDASIAQAACIVGNVTNALSSGSNLVDVPFGDVVEVFAREKPRYYPYVGPYAFRVTALEMSVEIAAKPIPRGLEGNPFEIGDNLFATTNTEGVLTITGKGAMDDFSSASDVPWVAPTVTALEIGEGVTKIGANAWMGMSGEVVVDGGLPLSRYAFVGDGFSSSESPAGSISPAEFERIDIIDGKALLDVSVYTSDTLTNENWSVATNGVIEVPAPGKQGFFILKSKGVTK